MPQDEPRRQYEDGILLVGRLIETYPQIHPNKNAVCSKCSRINIDRLTGNGPEGKEYYLHSESYHALVASSAQKCPICLLMLQAIHTSAGTGDIKNTLTMFDPKRTDRPITLRAVRRPELAEEGDVSADEPIKAIEVRVETWWAATGRGLLTVFALPDTPAAKRNVQTRVPLSAAEKWTAMKNWLKTQKETLLLDVTPDNSRLPTRLIDVGEPTSNEDTNSNPVHILDSSTLPSSPSNPPLYIALSYRWGEGNTLKTTKSTIAERKTSIPREPIPKTILDAITVTRRLGIRYLWVDSLCIIQDDADDWTKEAARMGDVYMNAVCTIAAHGADHADYGFLDDAMGVEKVFACGGRGGRDEGAEGGDTNKKCNVNEEGSTDDSGDRNKEGNIVDEGHADGEGSNVNQRGNPPGVHEYGEEMAAYEEYISRRPKGNNTTLEDNLNGLSLTETAKGEDDSPGSTLKSTAFNTETIFITKGSYARHHLDKSELSTRGWVMQERILSPRTIHFGKVGSMYFETRDMVEHIDTGKELGYRPFPGLRDALGVLDKSQEGEILEMQGEVGPVSSTTIETGVIHLAPSTSSTAAMGRDKNEKPSQSHAELVYQGWHELISRYSGCLLTERKDKLLALSGIVRKLQQVNKDRYISGIWLHPAQFHICLLWVGEGATALEDSPDAGAPSWSWASVHGKIQYVHGLLSLAREMPCMIPEVKVTGVIRPDGVAIEGDIVEGRAILELSGVVMIDETKTPLKFVNYRMGVPFHYDINNYINLDKPARMWDVCDGDGNKIGWASLDQHTGVVGKPTTVDDGLPEGIICFKVASHTSDRLYKGHDRGFLVLLVVFDTGLDVWRRVGMGQITERKVFEGVEGRMVRLG